MDGQQVLFHYNAYNENGGKIDSSYNKGKPAQTRLGTKGLIPGEDPITRFGSTARVLAECKLQYYRISE